MLVPSTWLLVLLIVASQIRLDSGFEFSLVTRVPLHALAVYRLEYKTCLSPEAYGRYDSQGGST